MKKTIYSLAIALAAAAGFASCNEDPVAPPVPEPEGGFESVGNGAWDKPVSAYQAVLGYTTGNTDDELWVCGYIVGWIDTDANATHTLDAVSARFTTPATVDSNMLIAMSPDETDWTKCASVQLPSGNVRNNLNLVTHPENLGKQVTIKGTTGSKYCGAYGVRSVSMFNWGDEGIYEEPQAPVPPVPGILENITFTKVANVDADTQYLLVFNGNIMAGPVVPATYSYGYLPVSTVTPDGDNIITSTVNTFYFYTAEGGYEIRDAYGRYLWWDSDPSHKSFQLTAKRGTEGMIWTVTPQEDGTVAIKNVEMNVTIQYSEQYGNVSAYSNVSMPLPVLYKRAK